MKRDINSENYIKLTNNSIHILKKGRNRCKPLIFEKQNIKNFFLPILEEIVIKHNAILYSSE